MGGFAKLRPFIQQDRLVSMAMTIPTLDCDNGPRFSRWWPGLLLICALGLSGCKTLGSHEDSLRDNGLSEPARQARTAADASKPKTSKAADDPWMSEEAQKISRDLQ
jgi:hypothetical protein